MKDFLYFEGKSTIAFRSLISSGVDMDKLKVNVSSFLKYVSGTFQENLTMYSSALNLDSIQLENTVDAKYKFLFKGVHLKGCITFLQELEKRVPAFKGKEANLRAVIGFYFLYYMVIVRIVETYLGALTTYNVTDPNNVKYTLKDIGIDNSILKYFSNFEDLRLKTIDEWIAIDVDSAEDKYYVLALKRIFAILGAN